MNNKKRITSLFVCVCMLVTLFSGFSTVHAAKNGVVIDFEQAELKASANSHGFNDMIYTQGDGWTLRARRSHEGHSAAIVDGNYGKTSKVLKVATKATTTEKTSHDPTNQVTLIPDNSNRMSSTSQYFEVEFDLMMNGKSNLEFMGAAARGTESGRPMRLLLASNGTSKVAKVDMAKDGTSIALNENKWNHFQFVFQSSDITNANSTTDDKHKYWVYVNGALTASGENKFVTDRGGYVSQFFGFDNLDIRMLTDFNGTTRETTSSAEMYLDNISLGVYEAFPETAYVKSIDFDSIGVVSDTQDAAAAYKANTAFFAQTSGSECLNKLEFVGGALGKDAKDISAKLYQTEEHKDVQRLVLRETGYESNKAPVINPGEWYMVDFEMAKVGIQSEGGIHAFYNHDMGHDGKGGPVLMKVTEGGSLYVNDTETGEYIGDDAWHKYTLAIRAADPDGEGDAAKDWIKLYVDNIQVLSEEFKTTTRVNGGAFEMLPEFKGIKQLWFQNFQKGAFDAAKANASATYFDNITVGNMGKTKKFDIEILDNSDPVINIDGAKDGDEFDGDSLPVITATASDDYGIKKFDYYFDGQLIETAGTDNTITASFDDVTGGKHTLRFVAEDIYGLTVEKTIEIAFVINKENLVYENNFEKYAGGKPDDFPQGTDNGGHGYMKDITVDEEHGKSMAIGIQPDVDESGEKDNWNTGGGNTAWVGMPVFNNTPTHTEFEFNISNRPAKYSEENGWQTTHDDFYRMYLRASGEVKILFIRPDYIELSGFNMEVGESKVPYDTNKWYKMDISINPSSSTIGIEIKDGDTVLAKGAGVPYTGDLQAIRVASPYHGLSDGYIAIDNLVIKARFGMPEFTYGEEAPKGGVNQFTVKVTESLLAADVTEETLTLENQFGEVAVKKAVITGNDLVITTVSPIFGNMDYTLTLPKETRFSTGDEVGFKIQNTITTASSDLELTNGDLGSYSFKFDMLNTTGKPQNITLIFQTWNEKGQVTAVKAVTKEIAPNDAPQNYVIVHEVEPAKGEKVTAFVWNGLNKPQVVCPVVYMD